VGGIAIGTADVTGTSEPGRETKRGGMSVATIGLDGMIRRSVAVAGTSRVRTDATASVALKVGATSVTIVAVALNRRRPREGRARDSVTCSVTGVPTASRRSVAGRWHARSRPATNLRARTSPHA
jgi:alanine dehydrogenase